MNYFKYYIYLFSVLASVSFFNPLGLITPQTGKFFFYLAGLIGFIIAIRKGINTTNIKYPRTAYKLILIGIIFSILMVYLYQKQSFTITVMTTIPYIVSYLFFYILLKLNISPERIKKTIWILCFCGIGIYFINLIGFPNLIFGSIKEEYDTSRGIIRIGIPFIELIILFFFYSINQWLITKKKKWIIVIIAIGIIIILSVIRQYIILSALLGFFLVMKNKSITNKITIIILCSALFIYIVPQIPIYKTMMQLSKQQVENNKYAEEDIRIKAWRFYTYEYQTNEITAIFGNGIPTFGNSPWGNKVEKVTDTNRCFGVDVGWAGFYWYFGLLSTGGLLLLMIKATLKKKRPEDEYLTYWIIFITLTALTSGPILFYNQIFSISTVLYLIYARKSKNSRYYLKLQQLRRYNQLHKKH